MEVAGCDSTDPTARGTAALGMLLAVSAGSVFVFECTGFFSPLLAPAVSAIFSVIYDW